MLKVALLLGFVLIASAASISITGGYTKAEVDEEAVVAAAGHASRSLSAQFNSKYHHILVKIVKAEKQVVAGMNYRMDILLGMTTCRKDGTTYEDAAQCEMQTGVSTYKKCTVVVYRNLDGKHKLVSSGCILAENL